MSVDASLFGDDLPEPTTDPADTAKVEMLPAWQIDALRAALDRCGVDSMNDRQRLVAEIVGRPVAALKELTAAEAGALRDELHRRAPENTRSGSAWDQREGDTWIDRL
ncbi:hypothetical protein [Pimelobacter simplex]|uniref:hypothetical protein n=1 Tax=Nocardioides simplex TaxID=2045 RepID=UPI00193373D6|nr:hypothetical protein [Pimelobacter simplex]